jgi:chemotaxis protein MotB
MQNRRVDMIIISSKNNLTDQQILATILGGTFDPSKYPERGGVPDVLVPENRDST